MHINELAWYRCSILESITRFIGRLIATSIDIQFLENPSSFHSSLNIQLRLNSLSQILKNSNIFRTYRLTFSIISFFFSKNFFSKKKRLRKKMFCQSLSKASILDFQRNRRRTVRGYRGARILQRSGRVSLYPTNPGKRTPLPPQWSCAQGPEST